MGRQHSAVLNCTRSQPEAVDASLGLISAESRKYGGTSMNVGGHARTLRYETRHPRKSGCFMDNPLVRSIVGKWPLGVLPRLEEAHAALP